MKLDLVKMPDGNYIFWSWEKASFVGSPMAFDKAREELMKNEIKLLERKIEEHILFLQNQPESVVKETLEKYIMFQRNCISLTSKPMLPPKPPPPRVQWKNKFFNWIKHLLNHKERG